MNLTSLIIWACLLTSGLFIWKLFYINWNADQYKSQEKKVRTQFMEKKPNRGNLFDAKGKLLVGNDLKYDVYFDPVSPQHNLFYEQIDSLSIRLSELIGKRPIDWKNKLTKARKKNKRYVPIVKGVGAELFSAIRNCPIFNTGKYRGGLIFNSRRSRYYIYGDIAKRTLGYDDYRGRVGLEGYFSRELRGKSGTQLKEQIASNLWRPISDKNNKEPQDGSDLYTTIDVDIQEVVHQNLKKQLMKLEADHGTAVVMEVKTGKIRAISNLGKNRTGEYTEQRNYAVWEQLEPGSTFKLFSMMVALEDRVVDTATMVNALGGKRIIHGIKIRDSKIGEYDKISMKRAFEISSNVGAVSIVYDNYRKRPEKFVNRLFKMGLYSKTGIEIPGETKPKIPHPRDIGWSGISLPWMAFGYGLTLTPLQILTIYNGVANDGILMPPTLVEKIVSRQKGNMEFKKQSVNRLASKSVIKKLQKMMEGVVSNGTAKRLNKDNISFAGKTGTTQFEYWKNKEKIGYLASFVGYFPAKNPKYSCIVVISKPKTSIAYYGSDVAGPVFYNIAENINVRYLIAGEDEIREFTYDPKIAQVDK